MATPIAGSTASTAAEPSTGAEPFTAPGLAPDQTGRLAGRVAVVTGAGQGLGRGIAEALADEGAAVALLGRTESKVVAAAEELSGKGARVLALRCDVAERADAQAAVAATLAAFGAVDILINNAQGGNNTVRIPTVDATDAQLLESFETGPLGSVHMMQACFEALRDSGRGAVVNFGSGIGVRGAPGLLGEAIGGLTKVTAIEWGRYGIRVNQVCPAAWSPAAEEYMKQSPERWEAQRRQTPLRRLGDPYADIGKAIVGLVSDDMQYLTGATLMLDGGQVLLR
ncbi:SDR family NAD(P)-dependent oxidoreductase [Candidatus Frankia alpina]|uniref:SDR family NAD(P)-dependent oxidoreductase n=1 Tax=Candidatus Frankia alpina TaxID=2699483 RepID=UPI001F281DA6|nr:SDR family oxidoreductase [Candidatus Frankia alpina]